jgi:hypothetical protein
LVYRAEDDKSLFLAQAGFSRDNPDSLDAAIRDMLRTYEGFFDRRNVYGEYFHVEGDLPGANGRILPVVTIWIVKAADKERLYRFVTLKPWRRTL